MAPPPPPPDRFLVKEGCAECGFIMTLLVVVLVGFLVFVVTR